MSTHGASGLTRWAIGSVTERVIRHSAVPLLVLPAEHRR
jgi:nucleotide-binding universal stress UspA family protein